MSEIKKRMRINQPVMLFIIMLIPGRWALQDDEDELHPQMDNLEAVIEDLSNTGLGTRDLERDLQNKKQKQEDLQANIAELLSELDVGTQVVNQFQDELSSAGATMSSYQGDLNSIGPVKRDENGLQTQLRQAEIDALKTQLGNLKSKADNCKRDIENMLDTLDRAIDHLRRTRTSIDRASDELDMLEPIGTDVNAIKRQEEELQMLEPLQRRVEEGSSMVENLMQTAAPGVNTEQLEAELESMNDKWTDLKKKISRAISYSCPVSRSTVQAVDDCPDSEEKWKDAAARKNCSVHASQCDEPDHFVYHCVINSFVNQTLEVCAYSRIIVLGYCTEYSLGGNIIQQSFRATCTQFTENPCSLGYPSTDAYKYPGCYGLTKKTTATSTLSTTNHTSHVNNDKQAGGGSSTDIILPVILVVVLLLIVVLVGIYCSFFRKKDPKNIYETETEESLSLRVPCDTETEDIHIAQSGQIIGNGIKTRKIKIVNEEILPEHYLKPEEDPKEDCQTLLNRISDGLTVLAIIHSENSNADNQLNLANLHHGYDNPGLSFSQESRHTFEDDLAQVESLIEYFKKQKNKPRICKE